MNRILIVLSIAFIITTFVIGCVNNKKTNDGDSNNSVISSFSITIKNTSSEYSVIVPLPVNDTSYIEEFINLLEFKKGSANLEVINTTYGRDKMGLKISSNQDLKIESMSLIPKLYRLSHENRFENDTSWYDNNPSWWIFYNSSQNTSIYIEIRYELDQRIRMDGYAVWGDIEKGWNIVRGKKLVRID